MPVTAIARDELLEVDVVRRRWFRAGCRCGWTSSTSSRYGDARAELAEHRRGCSR